MRLTHPHFPDLLPEDRSLLTGAPVPEDSNTFRLDQTVRASKSNLTSRKFSHYELLEVIGDGQFGTVWRANDQRLDRIVALKLPHLADWDEVRRTLFLREARAAATLEHPHIVRDRKSTRLNSSHPRLSRMPSSA